MYRSYSESGLAVSSVHPLESLKVISLLICSRPNSTLSYLVLFHTAAQMRNQGVVIFHASLPSHSIKNSLFQIHPHCASLMPPINSNHF